MFKNKKTPETFDPDHIDDISAEMADAQSAVEVVTRKRLEDLRRMMEQQV